MDISMSDIGWVLGAVVLYAIARILFTHRAVVAQMFGSFSVVRSGPPPTSDGPRTSPVLVVRPDTDQVKPEPVRNFQDVVDFLKKHNLTDEQLIAVYAVIHRAADDYPLSANKIRDVVGGTRDEVLALVSSYRPKPPAPKPSGKLVRPENGW